MPSSHKRRQRLVKKRSGKAGLPPGTPVHIGEKVSQYTKISVMDYDEAGCRETELTGIDECLIFKDRPTVTWINIEGVHDTAVLQKLGECYGIHPLTLEDIMNTDQRPKREDFGSYIYIVLSMLHPSGADNGAATEQVSLILGENFVFSFQEGIKGDAFDPVRERIRSGGGRIRKFGADYLAYSLIDSIVDNYFSVLEGFGERIEALEDELVENPTPATLGHLHAFKREMIFLRKSVWPLREVISGLQRGESPLIRQSTVIYLRDVYDHTIQVIDTIETFRDMLSGMLDIYLSGINNRMNSVMKTLTFIATIFMPLTFIAGIYGMNFSYMPELQWRWGYPVVLLGMAVAGALMVVYFRKKKWM
ncbi:MAG: magnesium/cobalt transporter CorA [Thermodesulfovibrionales bacterium]|nr:magnesium/cobalt transporter CorA [Thermodesulfovibrionales bacterium]